jgi:hypothetical protein
MGLIHMADELIAQAEAVLADPTKAEYHEQLSELVGKLRDQQKWWTNLNISMRELDAQWEQIQGS